jgi:hypothetical protein
LFSYYQLFPLQEPATSFSGKVSEKWTEAINRFFALKQGDQNWATVHFVPF